MLTNDEGIELLFKRGEGVYTPGKGKKDIPVTYTEHEHKSGEMM